MFWFLDTCALSPSTTLCMGKVHKWNPLEFWRRSISSWVFLWAFLTPSNHWPCWPSLSMIAVRHNSLLMGPIQMSPLQCLKVTFSESDDILGVAWQKWFFQRLTHAIWDSFGLWSYYDSDNGKQKWGFPRSWSLHVCSHNVSWEVRCSPVTTKGVIPLPFT